MSGYNLNVTRDVNGDVLTSEIRYYVKGPTIDFHPGTEFITSEFFENPKIIITALKFITIENDPDQDTNDGLWNTMEASIRSFAEGRMGVDDDSNLVASERDIVKLLNGMIFLARMADGNEYKGDGLLAHVTTSSFTVGDTLNTANKVTDYYGEVLRELHDSVISERDTFLDNRL